MYQSNLLDANIISGVGISTGVVRREPKRSLVLNECCRPINRVLKTLADDDYRRLEPLLEQIALVEDENIYQPDDKIRYVYFPETAVISQFYILEDGRTMESAMIGRDGAAGYAALFGAPVADCFSQISAGGVANRVSVEALGQEFRRGGALQKLLLEFTNFFVAQISRSVVCSNFHSIEKRFCTWLLMLSDRHGSSKINLTHSRVAGYLGVHRPSFTHVANTLRERQIIDYTRGQLKILNRRALLNSSCDCYAPID